MASQEPALHRTLADLATNLHAERELVPRARLIVEHISALLEGAAGVVLYMVEDGGTCWSAKATRGDVGVDEPKFRLQTGTLGVLAEEKRPLLFSGYDLTREDYGHLHVRRTVASLAYLPIQAQDTLLGAIEIASFDAPVGHEALQDMQQLLPCIGLSLRAAMAYETERNNNLESLSRLAQLYDLEKVFNSTPEMDELTTLVTSKFQEILNAQAVNLWMVQAEDSLLLVNRTGREVTIEVGTEQRSGEGIAISVADAGTPVLIAGEDERLAKRNEGVADGSIASLMAAPLIAGESVVGVVEVINKLTGVQYDEDDLFLLGSICETAAGALHNASLLQAERKVEILQTLVEVSNDLTSTLHLDRVVQAIVNGPQAVIPYERAAVAVDRYGRTALRAISGMARINPGDPEVARLRGMMEWAAISEREVFVTQHEDVIDEEREDTRARFRRYFAETGMRAFYAVPLVDDQGRVGTLSFESTDPDFLAPAHFEMIRVLSRQATVALRNAQLYTEVPLIGVLEPLLHKKRKFLEMDKRRRMTVLTLALAGLLLLLLCPIPMRLDGSAMIAPAQTARIQPEVEGVVRAVYVREGDPVRRGTVLAQLEDWDYRAALASAEAKYGIATAAMSRALAAHDASEAGIQQQQTAYWESEVARARERVQRAQLHSPIDGVVATPHVENLIGRRLELGDTAAEVVDISRAVVNVDVGESALALLNENAKTAVKVDSFPDRTFTGKVLVVSPRGTAEADRRFFQARVEVANSEGVLRPGMQGRAKISAGWHPAGYVLFRGPALWARSKLWAWVGL
jgi:RND family efflux transporter MFP subunit